jgi:membrane-bound lytic murein transglycosylase B
VDLKALFLSDVGLCLRFCPDFSDEHRGSYSLLRTYVFFLIFAVLGQLGCSSLQIVDAMSQIQRSPAGQVTQASLDQYAMTKLRDAGLPEEFIEQARLSSKQIGPESRRQVQELNVLGFLKRGNYDRHFDARAIRVSVAFAKKHSAALSRMESQFGVAREAVVALMWVETQFGFDKGAFPIAGVFFLMLQVDHPAVEDRMMDEIKEHFRADYDHDPELARKLNERVRKRAALGLDELKALYQMKVEDHKAVFAIRGSFAGAFGLPQFLPSSYLAWAAAYKEGSSPNLFLYRDAIMSVGSYLHSNGWLDDCDVNQHDALFHYNHSEGYVAVILKLAQAIRKRL